MGLLLPAVQSARETARRGQAMNNLKQILLAMPWTKPEDLAFDPDKPFDGLGTDRRPGGLFVAG